ncbi:MAG: WhiB family transcriptional regulator [Actinomycetota bacterium]|jgi:WhiB family redox-sensing transcriptional regulator|nr:WhiB family transcriptional regulator [Actinomycetota bacterium]MBW3646470.1 WhiB family transcriptional regulator [Actinomycetota bacterium]MDQ3503729.1 WhiB family transcriptional regulator [Actinomycetota bacterium]MDQ3611007.1 WhiB family transcriptional regulator [Actinomycetota bacterium]
MNVKSCTNPTVDPAVFFPETPEQLATAQAACAGCPFTEQCLAEALAVGTTDGVWGGVLLERGALVAVKRRPGRPRKVAVAA